MYILIALLVYTNFDIKVFVHFALEIQYQNFISFMYALTAIKYTVYFLKCSIWTGNASSGNETTILSILNAVFVLNLCTFTIQTLTLFYCCPYNNNCTVHNSSAITRKHTRINPMFRIFGRFMRLFYSAVEVISSLLLSAYGQF